MSNVEVFGHEAWQTQPFTSEKPITLNSDLSIYSCNYLICHGVAHQEWYGGCRTQNPNLKTEEVAVT
jgi:hypothetical protein